MQEFMSRGQECQPRQQAPDQKKTLYRVIPARAVHPGEILHEELQARGIRQKDFAMQIGVRPSHLNELIDGKRNMSEGLAMKLEEHLGIPSRVWKNLQSGYTDKAPVHKIQANLLQKLERLKDTLRDNWNGEGDFPLEERAYNNAKSAIKFAPSILLEHWRLFPNPNGTLLFSPKGKSVAGISIGNKDFSYAAFVSDSKQISGKEPFSEQAFTDALMQIHRILRFV